jgi:hypothetical protein
MRKIDADLRRLMKLASEKKLVFVSGFKFARAITAMTRRIARNAFWTPRPFLAAPQIRVFVFALIG